MPFFFVLDKDKRTGTGNSIYAPGRFELKARLGNQDRCDKQGKLHTPVSPVHTAAPGCLIAPSPTLLPTFLRLLVLVPSACERLTLNITTLVVRWRLSELLLV